MIALGVFFTYVVMIFVTYYLGHYISARFKLRRFSNMWADAYDIKEDEPMAWIFSVFWVIVWPICGVCYFLGYVGKKLTGGFNLRKRAIKAGTRAD